MPIPVTCQCGAKFAVKDEHAGRNFRCPKCGQPITAGAAPEAAQPAAAQQQQAQAPQQYAQQAPAAPQHPAQLQYASMGGGAGMVAPPPNGLVPPPYLEPKWRYPGCPIVHLVFIVDGAVVNCGFNPSPALLSVAKAFSGKLKKQFDVVIGPPPGPGIPTAFVRIINMDEGSRMLRYFLGIFAGGTTFEVEGNVIGPQGRNTPFHFKHRGRMGLFGGDSLNLLKASGSVIGGKIGKAFKNA
jgi:hypothetical protein